MVLLKRLTWKLGSFSRGTCFLHTCTASLVTQKIKCDNKLFLKNQVYNNSVPNFYIRKRLFCCKGLEYQKYQDVIKTIGTSKLQSDLDNSDMAKTEIIEGLEKNIVVNINKSASDFKSDVKVQPSASNVNTSSCDSSDMDAEKNSDFSFYEVAQDIEEFGINDENEIQKQDQPNKEMSIGLERGKSGVFNLEELLEFMNDLGAENVVTIDMPPEANFCDHMVIASTKSLRHMKAMNAELLWVYKRKKSKTDSNLIISGENTFWSAMDMGNIILHLFYGDAREFYDLESLWSLGPDADPKCQEQESNKYDLSAEDLFWLEAEQLQENSTSEPDQTSPSTQHPISQDKQDYQDKKS